MQLFANASRFTCILNGRPDFAVYAFSGRESVHSPYEFNIELVSRSRSETLSEFIGAPALLTVFDRSGIPRFVHGLVREMRQLSRGNAFTHYHCVVVPRLWFLSQNSDHRIFQNKSVPDIITQILREQGFAPETFAFKCFTKYQPREYCVQYGESDLYFISRLCEEEGIYYYFEHSPDGHCLCFSDMQGGPDIPGNATLRFCAESGQNDETAVIRCLNYKYNSCVDTVTYRDWNFKTTTVDLTAKATETSFEKAPAPAGMIQERFQYPHLYQTVGAGKRYAGIQLLREMTFVRSVEGFGDVARLLPGFTFLVYCHPRTEVNDRWWVTSVIHSGKQPQVLEHEAPDRGLEYHSTFQAIPAQTRFVPSEFHPKVRITNKQTAIVCGPAGEEIYTDEHGRVKVQFFWDREGLRDENASCWIWVSQGWAGTRYGTLALPRIGHEVIVSFLEGDPDRPVVTGRVYHADNKPPYELPVHKTRTVFKSMSTPGGEGKRGFNEFRIEDKTGQEEIYIHAEKDVNVRVKNDWSEHILQDKHRTVNGNTFLVTENETHEVLRGQRKTEQFANENHTVHGNAHTLIEGSWFGEAGAELHLESGIKLVLHAGSELVLKAGGAWVKINDSGVSMDGAAINLNCGGAGGDGTKAAPELPRKVQLTGTPPPPEAPRFAGGREFTPPPKQCLCDAAQDKNPCVIFPE